MPVVGVIQARMGSSRLPGKVLRSLGARSTLAWVVRAAVESGACDEVIVATTVSADDDAIAHEGGALGCRVSRGSVDDVLSRFLDSGVHDDDVVVRLTADCPLLDPAVIAMAVRAFDRSVVDYLSTVTPRSLPRGLDVEVVAVDALQRASALATGPDRAHVTSYVYRHPQDFRIAGLCFQPDASDLRVTLDTAEDATLLDAMVDLLGDRPPPWRAVVELLRSRPDLVAINAGVEQKPLDAG
jgi:spore coat polysaccharide biosynthesis protein SpsF